MGKYIIQNNRELVWDTWNITFDYFLEYDHLTTPPQQVTWSDVMNIWIPNSVLLTKGNIKTFKPTKIIKRFK